MSEAEDELAWQMHAIGLDPIRQFHFGESIGRRWAADFAFLPQRLLLEVEGGTWVAGRHVRGEGFEQDCEKSAEAAILGWTQLRLTSKMVEDGRALTLIETVLRNRVQCQACGSWFVRGALPKDGDLRRPPA